MISLEHVRDLIDNPPEHVSGRPVAFCDFAGPGDESVLALCDGNRAEIVDAWRSRDTMNSVGRFLTLFRKLDLQSCQIGGTHDLRGLFTGQRRGHEFSDILAESALSIEQTHF